MKDISLADLIVTCFFLVGLVMIYQDKFGWGYCLAVGFLLAISIDDKKSSKRNN